MTSPQPAARTVHLSFTGQQARIAPDAAGDGYELFIGGELQSHVDLTDPTQIRFEYLRRVANVVDALAPGGEPMSVLHIGAGAMTLPRYVQVTRPGSPQVIADIDRELVSFVTANLPLPTGSQVRSVTADARDAVAQLNGERFDVVVVDLPTNTPATDHLAGPDFHLELLDILAQEGTLLVNVGDDDGLCFLATQLRALEEAATTQGYDGVWTLADAAMLEHLTLGNAVLAVGARLEASHQDLAAAGPHPAAFWDPTASAELADRIERE